MDISIYKLAVEKDACIELLSSKGLRQKGKTFTGNIELSVGEEVHSKQVTVDFYYYSEDNEVHIDWVQYWKDFLNIGDNIMKSIESSYGAVLVDLNSSLYALSFGRAHSYISSMADMDFGFDIAEIIYDDTTIDVKASRFFKQSKNKSITQYNASSFVTYEIGESNELVISKIIIDDIYSGFTLYKYKENMRFGTAVKLNSYKFKPNDILSIVSEFDILLLRGEKRNSLPRMNFLKKNVDNAPQIADLHRKLYESLIIKNSDLSLSYYIEDDGDIRINPSVDTKVELIFNGKVYAVDSYSIEAISDALNGVITDENIDKVSIRAVGDKGNQINLLKMLDYNTVYNGKDYCLYKGKWASFNKSYIDYIHREIVKVNEVTYVESKFELTELVIQQGKEKIKLNPDIYGEVFYTEYAYNVFLENEYKFILLDRKREHLEFKNVEFADLYDNDRKELIHVKIGDTSSLRYCIQQSVHSVELLNTRRSVLEVYGINDVKYITMLFVMDTDNLIGDNQLPDFIKSKSIYFQIELIDWFIKVKTLGYEPSIIITKNLTK